MCLVIYTKQIVARISKVDMEFRVIHHQDSRQVIHPPHVARVTHPPKTLRYRVLQRPIGSGEVGQEGRVLKLEEQKKKTRTSVECCSRPRQICVAKVGEAATERKKERCGLKKKMEGGTLYVYL